jgi:poly-gamma-glutamate capsule biosynthesis protein CapA/YwtB (metallophosphatase superfamily)
MASAPRPIFLCGDVMTGRGVDQILPHPSNPVLHERYVRSALEYLAMAEVKNGPIARPVGFSYIWGDAIEELEQAVPAARIINLETSITTSEHFQPKGINYRMHPGNIPCLTAAKVDCCVLSNNHVLDFGPSGLVETLSTLREAGIKTAGAGRNLAEASAPAAIDTGADSRALVFAAGTADSGIDPASAANEATPGVTLLPDFSDRTVTRLAEQVARYKRTRDVVILSIHWGDNWGYEISWQYQAFAHQLIDVAGVDLVHGHSSHHPKGIEVYQGKLILYGCGDFLNDYEGIAGYEGFRSHLVLAYFVTIDPETGALLRLEMMPFETRRLQLCRVGDSDREWLRTVLSREGEALGSGVDLDGSHLVLKWRRR